MSKFFAPQHRRPTHRKCQDTHKNSMPNCKQVSSKYDILLGMNFKQVKKKQT